MIIKGSYILRDVAGSHVVVPVGSTAADFNGMITWIIAGLPWDAIHGVSNFLVGVLIAPLISVIRLAEKGTR